MKFRQIGAIFCCILVISGCASSTSYDFFTNRYSLDIEEFDRGYNAGLAFAKTEGPFSSSPCDWHTPRSQYAVENRTPFWQAKCRNPTRGDYFLLLTLKLSSL